MEVHRDDPEARLRFVAQVRQFQMGMLRPAVSEMEGKERLVSGSRPFLGLRHGEPSAATSGGVGVPAQRLLKQLEASRKCCGTCTGSFGQASE